MVGPACIDIWRAEESPGVSRLAVEGELDVETGPILTGCIEDIGGAGRRVLLDLSGVTFIDCTGLAAILSALQDARSEGWKLEVDADASRPVRRIVEISGVEQMMWP
jgi:anti-anti-sigma factor